MQPHAAEQRHLERQIAYARPIFMVLALGDLLEEPPEIRGPHAISFVFGYLCVALVLLALQYVPALSEWRIPLVADIAALAFFLLRTHSPAAFWFLYLFVALAAGIRWGMEPSIILAGVVTLAVLLHEAFQGGFAWVRVFSWIALVVGTFTAGIGLAFLGDRNRRHSFEHEFLAQLTGMLKVERGIAESLRAVLDELRSAFSCEKAILIFRDTETERLFVWTVVTGQTGRFSPQNLPLARADGFLLDRPEATLCWNDMHGAGVGFGWNRYDGRRLPDLPRMPEATQRMLGLRSIMSATFDFAGQPVGRIFVGNRQQRFRAEDLHWFERIVRHLAPQMESVFFLRHLRARAIEGERSRISRDIHDGILQTLLSVIIQLDVLKRKVRQNPEQAAADLATLQQTVRNESQELRRMVTDMRPIGVQSADLTELMMGFAERFREEAGLAVDLLVDGVALEAPEHICRELFQIYREGLHNVKKHARATHVVVKLWQNDSLVFLEIDDNGGGFSFAGRFTGDDLDRLRLGPISIKERTRSVGGVLTVESAPGHGARVTVEIPVD
jgi:signal transduction histidine kinase